MMRRNAPTVFDLQNCGWRKTESIAAIERKSFQNEFIGLVLPAISLAHSVKGRGCKSESNAAAERLPCRNLVSRTQEWPMAKRPILTTDSGMPVADNQNSITAGPRGPVLM